MTRAMLLCTAAALALSGGHIAAAASPAATAAAVDDPAAPLAWQVDRFGGERGTHARPSGHGDLFGAHQPVVPRVEGWLGPGAFFERHVARNRPVVFAGAAAGWPAIRRWTDAYLARKFGARLVTARQGSSPEHCCN